MLVVLTDQRQIVPLAERVVEMHGATAGDQKHMLTQSSAI
jgi:hypothetical protein